MVAIVHRSLTSWQSGFGLVTLLNLIGVAVAAQLGLDFSSVAGLC
jgi:hypothetical protein